MINEKKILVLVSNFFVNSVTCQLALNKLLENYSINLCEEVGMSLYEDHTMNSLSRQFLDNRFPFFRLGHVISCFLVIVCLSFKS